jgi:periplasmic divalent cation tolerance protein
MTDYRIVFTTTGTQEEARKIAHALVERKLAACVNIVPQVESVYRWEGKVEQAQEWLLLIKTTGERFPSVRDVIQELHSYDLPECISVVIDSGSPEYLKWLASC